MLFFGNERNSFYFSFSMASASPMWVVIVMNFIKTVIGIFDVITLPFHLLIQQPWKKTQASKQVIVSNFHMHSLHISTFLTPPLQKRKVKNVICYGINIIYLITCFRTQYIFKIFKRGSFAKELVMLH